MFYSHLKAHMLSGHRFQKFLIMIKAIVNFIVSQLQLDFSSTS